MKYFHPFFLTLFLFALPAFSQQFICGDELFIQQQRQSSANYDERQKLLNGKIAEYIFRTEQRLGQQRSVPLTYTIPVVFHVVHSASDAYGTGSNISFAQIQSQLNALNAAFSRNYPQYNGQSHPQYAVPTSIRFCLARIPAPASLNFYNGPGGTEYGVMRYSSMLTSHQVSPSGMAALAALTHPSVNHFPFSDYLNIWIVSTISGAAAGTIMGYAPNPLMAVSPLDGVIMRSDVTGDNSTNNGFNLSFGFQQGKVLAHEVGHYLNLRHIFEGGCLGANAQGSPVDACDLNGDCICDIEPCTTQNISCLQPVPNTCSANYNTGTTALDMINNYMSYADDDCQNTFTAGQRSRMWATLNLDRYNLWQYSNLGATGVMGNGGCVSATMYTDIRTINTSICAGSTFTLTNNTSGNAANSFTWTCASGTLSSAGTSSTTITFSAPGLYKIYLRVSNSFNWILDSTTISVSACNLDPDKMNRGNWLFSKYCSLDFSSGSPVVSNNIANANTMQCQEVSVSMSDSSGALLFYSNGVNIWDNLHVQRNQSPLFGWDLQTINPQYPGGTSVFGFMSFPAPGKPNKYFLVCVPPLEIKSPGNPLAKISYVLYDVITKSVTPYQQLTHPAINYNYTGSLFTGLSENLTAVPHCNGRDIWLVTRGANSSGQQVFYSFLVNPNGINPTPVLSPAQNISYFSMISNLKSNFAGNKLVCKTSNQNVGCMYDFNQVTGIVSNPVLLPTSNTTITQPASSCEAIIFSPNDSYIFSRNTSGFDKIDVSNMNIIQTIAISGFGLQNNPYSYCEVGPDNNIYFHAAKSGVTVLTSIVNPDAAVSSIAAPISFSSVPSAEVNNRGMLNFMEPRMPLYSGPLQVSVVSCGVYSFALNPCWSVYSASWNFGDGSPVINASSLTHTFTTAGVFTVSLTLTYDGQSLTPFTTTVQVINSVSVSGPSVICNGSPNFSSFFASALSNAGYTWTATNASIVAFPYLNNVMVGGGVAGSATVNVVVSAGGCTLSASKNFSIVDLPAVSLSSSSYTMCAGDRAVLTASPGGGVFSGATANNSFSASSVGIKQVAYTFTNSAGCFRSISINIMVDKCTDFSKEEKPEIRIYPELVTEKIYVTGPDVFEYLVTDLVGKRIKSGFSTSEISVADFVPGLYVLQIRTPVLNKAIKFIKE